MKLDVFVAPFEVIDSGGTETSYTGWTEGVPSLLPRTNLVALSGGTAGSRWMIMVPWDRVVAVCGGLLSPMPDASPARYATSGWPNAAQLATLEAAAVLKKGLR